MRLGSIDLGIMPPLPPDSWFKRTETLCGKFRKPCNEDHRGEEDPFLDCWDEKQEEFDALQQIDPWAPNAPKSAPDVKNCLYISNEGEDQPNDNSNDGEWWADEVDLNAVRIGNMSIDSKPVATGGVRGRCREITVYSGAGVSYVNPDDWPKIELKPSKGSVKGQRYVGPGGEKIGNLGELTVKVRTERHCGGDISSRMTFHGAKDRKPLLAVSGVTHKGNIVIFDGSGAFTRPHSRAGVAFVKTITKVQGRMPLPAHNGVFVLRKWEPEDRPSTDFSRRGAP